MPIGRGIRHREEFLLCLGEMIGHERAEIREGTACEEERDRERLSFELRGGDRLAELVGKMVVWQWVAFAERYDFVDQAEWTCLWRTICSRGRSFSDLIDPAFGIGHQHTESNRVARCNTGEFVGILYVKGHRHGRH